MWSNCCTNFNLWLATFLYIASGQFLTLEQESLFQDFISSLMQCRANAGLTISLVRGGDVIFSKGFGLRDVAKDLPMENNTKISIGSLTKAFTATLAADAVGQGLADWETPLREILGDKFYLEGDFRTQKVDMRDIFSHRLGMPSYWGFMTSAPNISREELAMVRLKYFTSLYDFRSHFLYANYPYVLAAYVTEVLTGSPWEEDIRTLIFDKLGMTDTKHAAELLDTDWDTNTAFSYVDEDGEFIQNPEQEQLPLLIEASPAGGIFSTANDMAKWMLFHLNEGKNSTGDQIIPVKALRELYTSINIRTDKDQIRRPTFPVEYTRFTYGMGFATGTYRGRRKVQHTGIYSGYNCEMNLLLEAEVGVWACVNSPGGGNGSMAARLANIYALDLLLDEEPWLNDTTACTFPEPWTAVSNDFVEVNDNNSLRSSMESEAPKINKSSNELEWDWDWLWKSDERMPKQLEDFEGDYGHMGFGIFRVFLNESGQLRYEFGQLLKGDLNPSANEMTFAMTLDEPLTYMMSFYPPFHVYFYTNDDGDVIQTVEVPYIDMSLPPRFERGIRPDT